MIDPLVVALAISALAPAGPVGVPLPTLALVVAQEAECYEVDPLLVVAVMSRESSFDVAAESGKGDHGLLQIRRGRATYGYARLSERQLHAPAMNVHLGVRRLSWARSDCPGRPSRRWIGGYAGVAGCVRTGYARRVLATLEEIRS